MPNIDSRLFLFLLSTVSSGIFKKDPNSFIFSLVNPSGLKSTKISLVPGKEGSAIYCGNANYGPVFGSNSSGYFDLCIGSAPNQSNNCSSYLNNSYRCPEGQNYSTFLAGNYVFAANEIEVFAFQK